MFVNKIMREPVGQAQIIFFSLLCNFFSNEAYSEIFICSSACFLIVMISFSHKQSM